MNQEVIIIVVDDDDGHSALIRKNLRRAGILNEIIRFTDGFEALEFFFNNPDESVIDLKSYLVLLDIRMPKVDGIEVLRRLKSDPKLKKIPVIMLTTTNDPREINKCHELGCNNYITKPVNYEIFLEKIRQIGLFLMISEIPPVNNKT